MSLTLPCPGKLVLASSVVLHLMKGEEDGEEFVNAQLFEVSLSNGHVTQIAGGTGDDKYVAVIDLLLDLDASDARLCIAAAESLKGLARYAVEMVCDARKETN